MSEIFGMDSGARWRLGLAAAGGVVAALLAFGAAFAGAAAPGSSSYRQLPSVTTTLPVEARVPAVQPPAMAESTGTPAPTAAAGTPAAKADPGRRRSGSGSSRTSAPTKSEKHGDRKATTEPASGKKESGDQTNSEGHETVVPPVREGDESDAPHKEQRKTDAPSDSAPQQ
jgi:hypothetical protein